MTKVIGIIEDNRITGVVYGEIEIADKNTKQQKFFNSAIKNARNIKALKILQQRTKLK